MIVLAHTCYRAYFCNFSVIFDGSKYTENSNIIFGGVVADGYRVYYV